MQTKAFPLFPIATWPRGNCLISNFGQLPEGRESRVYKISHVFTAHGGSDFFSPSSSSCSSAVRSPVRTCRAARHKATPSTHTQECVHVCVGTCCSGEATPKQGQLERENLKNRNCRVKENLLPRHMQQRRPNKPADGLNLEFKCAELSLLWLNPSHRGPLSTQHTTFNLTLKCPTLAATNNYFNCKSIKSL